MPFARSHQRGRFQGTSRRQTSWFDSPSGTLQRTTSGSTIFATGAQAVADGLTLVRIRAELVISLSITTAVLDGFTGAFGMGIVSENAFGAGVGSIPTPRTDVTWDGWMVYQPFTVIGNSGTDPALSWMSTVRYQIDSKAQRKIKSTDVLVAVIEATEVGTATMNLTLKGRLLAKIA